MIMDSIKTNPINLRLVQGLSASLFVMSFWFGHYSETKAVSTLIPFWPTYMLFWIKKTFQIVIKNLSYIPRFTLVTICLHLVKQMQTNIEILSICFGNPKQILVWYLSSL